MSSGPGGGGPEGLIWGGPSFGPSSTGFPGAVAITSSYRSTPSPANSSYQQASFRSISLLKSGVQNLYMGNYLFANTLNGILGISNYIINWENNVNFITNNLKNTTMTLWKGADIENLRYYYYL